MKAICTIEIRVLVLDSSPNLRSLGVQTVTVKELIDVLQTMPADATVVCNDGDVLIGFNADCIDLRGAVVQIDQTATGAAVICEFCAGEACFPPCGIL